MAEIDTATIPSPPFRQIISLGFKYHRWLRRHHTTAGLIRTDREAAGMLEDADLASGWRVWSAEADKLVLAYRPDVFDGGQFPAACLPTLYLTRGRRTRRPGPNRGGADAEWWVTLFLEPDVDHGGESFPTRESALDAARDLAARFADGELDYRDLYQVPRPEYVGKLDELTGGGS